MPGNCPHVNAPVCRIPQLTQPDVRFPAGIHVQIVTPLGQIGHEIKFRVYGMQPLVHCPEICAQLISTPAHVVHPHAKCRCILFKVLTGITGFPRIGKLKPPVFRQKRVKPLCLCPIHPVEFADGPVAPFEPVKIPCPAIFVKARSHYRIPHAADRDAHMPVHRESCLALRIGQLQATHMLLLAFLSLLRPVPVPVAIRPICPHHGFPVNRRTESDIRIQIVAVQIKSQKHVCKSMFPADVHHVLLLSHIWAGRFSLKPVIKILPRLAVKLHTVKAHMGDGREGIIKKRPVIISRAIKVSEPDGKQRFFDLF